MCATASLLSRDIFIRVKLIIHFKHDRYLSYIHYFTDKKRYNANNQHYRVTLSVTLFRRTVTRIAHLCYLLNCYKPDFIIPASRERDQTLLLQRYLEISPNILNSCFIAKNKIIRLIKNSIRFYTGNMEFPNSNQAGYFFNLGLACNNENCLNRKDGWVNGLPNPRGGTNEEIIWL